jgi:hypothetical protein
VINECGGGCGELVAFAKFCSPCQRLADEYAIKEAEISGNHAAALFGIVGMAVIFFLVGILTIGAQWMGHG